MRWWIQEGESVKLDTATIRKRSKSQKVDICQRHRRFESEQKKSQWSTLCIF